MMVEVAHSYGGRSMRLLPYLRKPRNRWWGWSQNQGKSCDHTGPSCDPLPPKGLYLLRVYGYAPPLTTSVYFLLVFKNESNKPLMPGLQIPGSG